MPHDGKPEGETRVQFNVKLTPQLIRELASIQADIDRETGGKTSKVECIRRLIHAEYMRRTASQPARKGKT
jgi:hypothetical protein